MSNVKIRNTKFVKSLRLFLRRIFHLFKQPIFISLTVFGNIVIMTGTLTLYWIEKDVNPGIDSPLDTLWWAMSTVTTVGYGDITPITNPGKVVGILMMIIGTALFWSYTALFADAVISKEIIDLEMELKDIQKRLSRITRESLKDKTDLKTVIDDVQKEVTALEQSLNAVAKKKV